MADPDIDDADLAVGDLKRRARRRLVGAIVLALAAAVILPLLLEREPRPLGDDVSVQIPPIDESRFVNRLTTQDAGAKAGVKPDAKGAPKSAPPKSEATAAAAAPTEPPRQASVAEAPPPAAPAAPPPKKSVSEAEQRVLAPAAKSAAKPAPEPAPATPPTPAKADPASDASGPVARGDGFVVQIAAFADDKGANAQAAKLNRAGYAGAYVEPVQTSRGTLWRVRVGGYATRADAEAARVKLKADGFNGLVVPAK
jgi:DedD protein